MLEFTGTGISGCRPKNVVSKTRLSTAQSRRKLQLITALLMGNCLTSNLKPLRFCQVRRTGLEKLFNSLIEHYHYIGYCYPLGEQLKYIVYSQQRPIACLAWSSAPRHIGCRDRFIGWSVHRRKSHIHLLAYN
jgi:hypothetical protein